MQDAIPLLRLSGHMHSPHRQLAGAQLPPIPTSWALTPGWTRYGADGSVTPVASPEETAIVFDVETCISDSEDPALATAVSSRAWYGWVSARLHALASKSPAIEAVPRTLIPLQGADAHKTPRLVVGHSVSYDRQRVLDEYALDASGLRFLDTMALHMATSGTPCRKHVSACAGACVSIGGAGEVLSGLFCYRVCICTTVVEACPCPLEWAPFLPSPD